MSFDEGLFVTLICFVVIVIPLWLILHYLTVFKRSKSLTNEDERMLEELYDVAERMESRITNLEKILDSDTDASPRSTNNYRDED